MAFFTQCWNGVPAKSGRTIGTRWLGLSCVVLLAACTGSAGTLVIERASLDPGGTRLDLDLDLRFSPTHLEALDHGVPLRLEFITAPLAGAGTIETIELSYAPLSDHYEMRRSDEVAPRIFQTRAQMLAALSRISLPIRGGSAQGFVRARLNIDALPPALRMTARFDRRWQLETRTSPWQA